jgi:hypothetical protein
MQKTMSQIKINVPIQVRRRLEKKAMRLGFSVPMYVKMLTIDDIKDEEPIHIASKRVLQAEKEALEDIKEGRLKPLNTDEDFETLFHG